MECSLVVCFGEMLVDFVPTVSGKNSKRDCKTYEMAAGGAPANVAVAISKLGGHSAMITKVGDDSFGHMLVEMLAENRVDTSGIGFDSSARTALSFVTLGSDGEREFMFYRNPSADMMLTESEIHPEIISRGSIFHFGSISLVSEPCKSAQLCAMRHAKSSGLLLSYDVNLRLPLWPSPDQAYTEIMEAWRYANIVKISDDELDFLRKNEAENTVEELIYTFWHAELKLLLLTEGAEGCRYFTKRFNGRVKAVKRVESIDSTGAGDAFMGGFLFRLSCEMDLYEDEERLRKALEFANACGALATTQRGAIPSLPSQESATRFMCSAA